MKIHIYSGSLRPGGGLTVLRAFINALAENSNNELVVYTGANDTSQGLQDLFGKYQNVIEKKFLAKAGSSIRYLFSKFYFLNPFKFKKKDTLISFNYLVPSFARKCTVHINLLHFLPSKKRSLLERIKDRDAQLACRYSNENIFESKFLHNKAEHVSLSSIVNPHILYIGIDEEFFKPRNTLIVNDTNLNLLAVTSMQPHKDNQTLLRVVNYLTNFKLDSNVKLTIVGGQSIEQWNELKLQARELGIESNIDFLGPVQKDVLFELFQKSLCLVNTSLIESFCMVAVEAMASGCPVIVTNKTSMPESVGNAGLIVEAGNEKAFVDAIRKIYEDNNYRNALINLGLEWSANFKKENFGLKLREIIEL